MFSLWLLPAFQIQGGSNRNLCLINQTHPFLKCQCQSLWRFPISFPLMFKEWSTLTPYCIPDTSPSHHPMITPLTMVAVLPFNAFLRTPPRILSHSLNSGLRSSSFQQLHILPMNGLDVLLRTGIPVFIKPWDHPYARRLNPQIFSVEYNSLLCYASIPFYPLLSFLDPAFLVRIPFAIHIPEFPSCFWLV